MWHAHKTGSYTCSLWRTTNSEKYSQTQIIIIPTKLYWVLFPTEDLWQAVETAKRILTEEKIDRQLAGQSFSTPFMSIKENYNNTKRVTFNTQDGVRGQNRWINSNDWVNWAANVEGKNKQFKLKIYQSKRRDQMRNFYDKCNYQNRYRSNSGR